MEGNTVSYEEITNGSTVDKILYNYGDSGLVGFRLNDTEEYFYIRNAQSDIIGILDSDCNQVETQFHSIQIENSASYSFDGVSSTD
ncbi:hypothetical protein [Clostridium sp.]|uniref:hypothetical protein n=1 Tax=Clostridium sp. TaxID=1506 RepID=UPI003216AE0B